MTARCPSLRSAADGKAVFRPCFLSPCSRLLSDQRRSHKCSDERRRTSFDARLFAARDFFFCFSPSSPPVPLHMGSDQAWRAVSLAAGLGACLVSGTLYGFGSWAPAMKEVFSWDQSEINLVGNIGDIGLYLGFTQGLIYDLTSPFFSLLLGGALQGLGYGLMALAVANFFPCPWPLMAFFFFLAGQGSFATYTAGYAPSLQNYSGKWRSRIMRQDWIFFPLIFLIFRFFSLFFFSVQWWLALPLRQ